MTKSSKELKQERAKAQLAYLDAAIAASSDAGLNP